MMLTANQQKEQKALSEKLAILDLEKQMIQVLADGRICNAELASLTFGGPYTINATSVDTLKTANFIKQSIHYSDSATSEKFISIDQIISSSQLKVSEIKFTNFAGTATPDLFIAQLQVSFNSGVRPYKPIQSSVTIKTDPTDPISAKKIISCYGNANICQEMGGIYNEASNPKCLMPAVYQ